MPDASKYEPRRAEPGQRFVFNHHEGAQVRLAADDEGIVQPRNAIEAEVADLLFLPVARKPAAITAAKEG